MIVQAIIGLSVNFLRQTANQLQANRLDQQRLFLTGIHSPPGDCCSEFPRAFIEVSSRNVFMNIGYVRLRVLIWLA